MLNDFINQVCIIFVYSLNLSIMLMSTSYHYVHLNKYVRIVLNMVASLHVVNLLCNSYNQISLVSIP